MLRRSTERGAAAVVLTPGGRLRGLEYVPAGRRRVRLGLLREGRRSLRLGGLRGAYVVPADANLLGAIVRGDALEGVLAVAGRPARALWVCGGRPCVR